LGTPSNFATGATYSQQNLGVLIVLDAFYGTYHTGILLTSNTAVPFTNADNNVTIQYGVSVEDTRSGTPSTNKWTDLGNTTYVFNNANLQFAISQAEANSLHYTYEALPSPIPPL